jgi:PAS domain S-box-containing protein
MNIFAFFEKKLYGSGKKSLLYRLLFSMMIILPVILVAIFSSITAYRDTTADIYTKRYSEAQLIENLIHERLGGMVLLAESVASRPKVVEYVKEGKWEQAIKYAEYILEQYEYIDSMSLVDVYGTVHAGAGSFSEALGKNLSGRDWYQGVRKNWEPYVSDIFLRISEPRINVVAVAVPIIDFPLPGVSAEDGSNSDNEVLGILTLQIKPEVFTGWLKEIQSGNNVQNYLVDKNGNLIAHTRINATEKIYDFSSMPPVQMLLDYNTGIDIFQNPETGQNSLTAYLKCSQHGWGLVIEEPVKSAFALRINNIYTQLPVYILFILLSFAITVLLLRNLARIREAWENSQKLALIIKNSEDAIYSRDLDDNIITWNRGAEKIYGYAAEEMIGKPFLIMVPKNASANYLKIIKNIKNGESIKNKVVQRIRKDGRRIFISLTSSPVKDIAGNITGISSISRDITKQINSDRIIREKSRQLEQLNAELEAFSYSVSHDLRGPLRGIDGFSSALEEDYSEKLDSQARDYIIRIKKASKRMGDLIDDLLMLSRVTRNEMKLKKINLSIIAQKISENLTSHYNTINNDKEKTQAVFIIEPDILVLADEKLMEVLLYNLLENSFKFSGTRQEPLIEFGKINKNGRETIFVKDNGVGFDMRYVDKIFNPFQRLHSAKEFPGTGIGLATVKRIIARHKGRIWIESDAMKGTLVYFVINAK